MELKSLCPIQSCRVRKALALIGLFFVAKKSFKALAWCYKNLLPIPNNLKAKYGDGWAIVTGGSDGIGLAIATELIAQGHKVVLVARNESKLKDAVSSLESKYPSCEVRYVVFDFDKTYNENDVKELTEKLEPYEDISILVNNAGAVTRGYLLDLTDENIHTQINVNLLGVTFMTKVVLEKMLKTSHKGLVVFSGSVDGTLRYASRSVYGSTKAYVESFSEIIAREYIGKIDTTYLEIGPVLTNMNPGEFYFKVDRETFAKGVLKRAGRYRFTTGCLKHEMFNVMYYHVPGVRCFINNWLQRNSKHI